MKRCSKCKKWKELVCFVKNKSTPDGFDRWCKKCNKIRMKKYYNKNIEKYTYRCMLSRCYNSKDYSYKDYGAKGVVVCKRWLESFDNFFEDMGKKPKGKTLDRILNNYGYCKPNCRWATHQEQNENRNTTRTFIATNKKLNIKIKTFNVCKFAREWGLTHTCIYRCLSGKYKQHKGWVFTC